MTVKPRKKWIVLRATNKDFDGTNVWRVLREGLEEHHGRDVWHDLQYDTVYCTACSGPMAAMKRSCRHALAVLRAIRKGKKTPTRKAETAEKPNAPKELDAIVDRVLKYKTPARSKKQKKRARRRREKARESSI